MRFQLIFAIFAVIVTGANLALTIYLNCVVGG